MSTLNVEKSCGLLVHDTARLLRTRLDQTVGELGLSQGQWRALALVAHTPGLPQSKLAGLLRIEKAPLGVTLDRLQADGWIRRAPDPFDRRVRRVHPEPKAEPALRQVTERMRAVESAYLRGFDPEEVVELKTALSLLRAWLIAEASPAPAADGPDNTSAGRARPGSASPGPASQVDPANVTTNPAASASERGNPADGLFELLIDCARLLSQRFDPRLATLGFTRAQWLVLNAVSEREGLRQVDLAGVVSLGAPALGKLVDALQAGHWLERRADPADRRANRLYLGRRARHILGATRERFEVAHADIEQALGPVHHRILVSQLGWIRHRLLEEVDHSRGSGRSNQRSTGRIAARNRGAQ